MILYNEGTTPRENQCVPTSTICHDNATALDDCCEKEDAGQNHQDASLSLLIRTSLPESSSLSPRPLLNISVLAVAVLSETTSAVERFRLVLSLWPYIIPMFTVYAAEYACQAGAWTAIGFPTVDSVEARALFYEQSNWLYQTGSLVSRSTGGFFEMSLVGLWILPCLQVLNLIFFSVTAANRGSFFYQRGMLLATSLYTGLLGGAVYVHGYKRIVTDTASHGGEGYTEFALSSTCVAEALGVLLADIIGLFLQSCLYSRNGISGALVQCPLNRQ